MMAVILVLSILPFRLFRRDKLTSAVGRSCWMALLTFTFVNCCLYPAILQYQAGMIAGDYLRRQLPDCKVVYMPEKGPDNYSIEFYSPCAVQRLSPDSFPSVLRRVPAIFFVTKAYSDTLYRKGFRVEPLRQFRNFHVSRLTGEFLDHRTREASVEWFELARVSMR